MKSLKYEDNELAFLEAMAQRFEFKDRCKVVFVQRLLTSNNDLNNDRLAEVMQKELVIEEYKDAFIIQRDFLKRIFNKLDSEGCDFNGVNKNKREIAQGWLQEEIYPQWLKDRLWEELKAKAKPTDKMGPVLVESVSSLGMRRREPSRYLNSVPVDSDIVFKLNMDRPGNLILLEKEPSGVVCCLCPSEYAPEVVFPAGEVTLPMYPPAPDPCFAATEVGKEQILAVIVPELPAFDWLAKSREEAWELDQEHLYGLLEYVASNSNLQILYKEYTVTAG